MSINVILADDHTIVRDGLRALLEANPQIKVVGDAADGNQVLSQVKELQPDVVVMDILMPELNGIEATRKIMESFPQVRVIILSMLGTADHVFRALQAGVRGFLLKESAGREVVDAVEAVYAGEMYFSRPITHTLVNDYMQMREETESESIEKLSLRENEILCLVVEGKTSAEIGRDLHLSPKTVESYRSRIMQKLGISDMPELIKYAIKHGLITLD
jgi:DNA-binding NarL/FixJ family response regulator